MTPEAPIFLTPDFVPAAGEITLLLLTSVVLLMDLFVDDRRRWITFGATLLTLAATAAVIAFVTPAGTVYTFDGSFVLDPLSKVLKIFTLIIVALVFVYSREYMQTRGLERGEFYLLSLFATLGILVMISAHSMLSLYLGLELLVHVEFRILGAVCHEIIGPVGAGWIINIRIPAVSDEFCDQS